jgi:hypothetical protein
MILNWYFMHDQDCVGRRSNAHLPLRVARLKGLKAWLLHLTKKIKGNEVQHVILDDLHTIMYMPIKPSESTEAFMTHGRNKIIENFTQHLPDDSWI